MRSAIPILVGVPLSFLTGCDAFMVVAQSVEVVIEDRQTGKGIPGATVDFALADRSPAAREKTDAAWLDAHRYHRATTDLSGHADLLFDVAWIAGGWFADTNTKRDRVRGKEYLFRIATEAVGETLKMWMKPDSTVSGDQLSITVISIGKPQKKDASWYSELRRPDD